MTDEITKDEITELALFEMLEHEILDVEFSWNYNKRRFGVVFWKQDFMGRKTPTKLQLSQFMFEALDDKWQMVDTLYHELAHILSVRYHGPKAYGHTPEWKQWCVKLGADPTRVKGAELDLSGYKYVASCSKKTCDHEFGVTRLGKIWKNNYNKDFTGRYYLCKSCGAPMLLKDNK